MQTITSRATLKDAILLLEAEKAISGQILKDQFHVTYKSYKPVNLIRSTIKDITSAPNLVDNLLGLTTGLATGYVSKKLIIGSSGNIIRKLIGSLLQLGVTTLVARNPDAIRSVGHYIHHYINRSKEKKSESRGK
jgi:hypothetical protein